MRSKVALGKANVKYYDESKDSLSTTESISALFWLSSIAAKS